MVWVTLLPAFVLVLLVPHLAAALARTAPARPSGPVVAGLGALAVAGLVAATVAVTYVHTHRPRRRGAGAAVPVASPRDFLVWCLAPFVVAAVLLTAAWSWGIPLGMVPAGLIPRTLVLMALTAAVHVVGGLTAALRPGTATARADARHARWWTLPWEAIVLAASGAVAGAFVAGAAWWVARVTGAAAPPSAFWSERSAQLYTMVALPTFLTVVIAAEWAYIGFWSRSLGDDAREWSARFGAWIAITATSWLALCAIVFFGPGALTAAVGGAHRWLAATGVAGAMTAILGHSPLTGTRTASSGGGTQRTVARVGLALAAPAFALGAMTALAFGAQRLYAAGTSAFAALDDDAPHWEAMVGLPPVLVVLLMAGLGLLTAAVSRRVDLNRFSLHAMYRARLIRAFLGGARRAAVASDDVPRRRSTPRANVRTPDGFTGFDTADNLLMGELWPNAPSAETGGGEEAGPDAAGVPIPARPGPAVPAVGAVPGTICPPLHVVNVALNLVRGTQLAWQQRKAATFTISPLHAGSGVLGELGAYRRTSGPAPYGSPLGISLGTAITISGAAASPNMGYHSSPAVTFLLTLLNARLGCWLGNPAAPTARAWTQSGPTSSRTSIVAELFGLTDAASDWVYLSDGGHFENLGLYEIVSRRCRHVVVSDASCDGTYAYEDLGNAIRKVRIDLGIPITFDAPLPFHRDPDGAGASPCWAVGRIAYSAVHPPREGQTADDVDGLLLYVKPALTGAEPKDVYNYARAHDAFPHESTSDQFFDEAQFESYRMLGLHTVVRALAADEMTGFWRVRDPVAPIGRAVVDAPVVTLSPRRP